MKKMHGETLKFVFRVT